MIAGHRVGHYSAEGKLLTPLTKKQIKAMEKTFPQPLRLLDDFSKPDTSFATKTGHFHLLTTLTGRRLSIRWLSIRWPIAATTPKISWKRGTAKKQKTKTCRDSTDRSSDHRKLVHNSGYSLIGPRGSLARLEMFASFSWACSSLQQKSAIQQKCRLVSRNLMSSGAKKLMLKRSVLILPDLRAAAGWSRRMRGSSVWYSAIWRDVRIVASLHRNRLEHGTGVKRDHWSSRFRLGGKKEDAGAAVAVISLGFMDIE
jgi:hypothetical protein